MCTRKWNRLPCFSWWRELSLVWRTPKRPPLRTLVILFDEISTSYYLQIALFYGRLRWYVSDSLIHKLYLNLWTKESVSDTHKMRLFVNSWMLTFRQKVYLTHTHTTISFFFFVFVQPPSFELRTCNRAVRGVWRLHQVGGRGFCCCL